MAAARNAVKRATDNLVEAAQEAIQQEEERSLVLNRKMVGGIAQEINARRDSADKGRNGIIVLVNSTKSDWYLVNHSKYRMKEWSFPLVVPSGDLTEVFVEWKEGLFKVTKDAAGKAIYELEGSGGKRLELVTRVNPYTLSVYCTSLNAVGPAMALREFVRWSGEHEMTFVVSEPQPGKYYTEHH